MVKPSSISTAPGVPVTLRPPGGEGLSVGQEIDGGRYEIRGRLGGGGMGVVWRAHDRKLDEDVALKVLLADRAEGPSLEQLRREVKIARKITHPNVCRVFDLGEDGGRLFLTMELVDGRTLRARLNEGPIPAAEAVGIFRQIVAGVAAAHAQGVIHRDLKPENVLLRRDGRALVADFGLARAAPAEGRSPDAGIAAGAPAEPTLDLAGTPAYMSPEQIRGEPLDVRSDVFALGLLGYELLTGRRPFGEGAPSEVRAAILNNPYAVFEAPDLPDGTGEELARVLARAMAKSPADRFASAVELAAAIEGLPGEDPRSAGPEAPEAPGRHRSGGSRWRAVQRALAAALVIAAAIGIALRLVPAKEVGSRDDRPAVALLPFENRTGEATWDDLARSAAPAAVRKGLAKMGEIRLLEGSPANEAIARDLGAAFVVRGRVERAGARLQVVSRIEPVESWSGLSAEPVELDSDPAESAALLESLRRSTADEARLLVRAHVRRARAIEKTHTEGAREKLLRYEALTGPRPQPEHFDQGLALLDAALAEDPRSGPALVERAYLRAMGAGPGTDAERMNAALADVAKALSEDPADASALVARCRIQQAAAELESAPTGASLARAKEACDAALLTGRDLSFVHLMLARMHDRFCRDDQAIASLEQAMELDGGLARAALYNIASIALQHDRLLVADSTSSRLVAVVERERKLGEKALSKRAGSPPVGEEYRLRGMVLLRLGRLEEARAALEREMATPAGATATPEAEAALLRGLTTIAAASKTEIAPHLARRLADLEEAFRARAEADPRSAWSVVAHYQFLAPAAATEWLDRCGQPRSCDEAFLAAIVRRVAGDLPGARRTLDACRPVDAWEASCRDRIQRIIGP